jgi:hypothetical protein
VNCVERHDVVERLRLGVRVERTEVSLLERDILEATLRRLPATARDGVRGEVVEGE